MAQIVFHASKVLDEFTFVLFLLPSAKEMRDWKKLASFTNKVFWSGEALGTDPKRVQGERSHDYICCKSPRSS